LNELLDLKTTNSGNAALDTHGFGNIHQHDNNSVLDNSYHYIVYSIPIIIRLPYTQTQ